MANSNGILRNLKIYITANGNNTTVYPSFVPTYRVEDEAGNIVSSNEELAATRHDGRPDAGHHACLLDFLPKLKNLVLEHWGAAGVDDPSFRGNESLLEETLAIRRLTIVTTDGEGILKAYTVPPAQLVETGFKWPSGSPVANAEWVKQVFMEANANRLTIEARKPTDADEENALAAVRKAGRKRWAKAA